MGFGRFGGICFGWRWVVLGGLGWSWLFGSGRFEDRWDGRGAVGIVDGDGCGGVVGLNVKSTMVE
jgi:hypothetical protein